jgi:hypothetical protein
MTTMAVFGMNSLGLTYTADFEPSTNDSVRWSAAYRFRGIFRGLRHGRIGEVSLMSPMDLMRSVMDDVEEAWGDGR